MRAIDCTKMSVDTWPREPALKSRDQPPRRPREEPPSEDVQVATDASRRPDSAAHSASLQPPSTPKCADFGGDFDMRFAQ
jgi:hypothetical protein